MPTASRPSWMKERPLRTRATDQSLRRLVAKLAQSSPDDVLGVLDRLAPAHRREVATLLKAYDGAFVDRDAAEDGPRARTGAWRVSPWLADLMMLMGGLVAEPAASAEARTGVAVALAELRRAHPKRRRPSRTTAGSPKPPA